MTGRSQVLTECSRSDPQYPATDSSLISVALCQMLPKPRFTYFLEALPYCSLHMDRREAKARCLR